MRDVDYIEYEPYGLGAGPTGRAGYIKKDYTPPKTDNIQPYEVPLSFSKSTKFYNSKFFTEYGTLDWLSNITLNEDASFDIKVLDAKNNFKLLIEGIVDEKHISKELLIEH